ISALIREDPARAERLVERLAALLRFSLGSKQGLKPLRRKLKIVTDYLEIERARFGDRLKYSIDIREALLDTGVPPMSIETPVDALACLTAHPPDALFLDIQMPGMSGFEMLAMLDPQPLTVFTTAFDQYALQAFEVNSIDYLLKPVEAQQLNRALAKLERLHA